MHEGNGFKSQPHKYIYSYNSYSFHFCPFNPLWSPITRPLFFQRNSAHVVPVHLSQPGMFIDTTTLVILLKRSLELMPGWIPPQHGIQTVRKCKPCSS
jgi:hypothetical protein